MKSEHSPLRVTAPTMRRKLLGKSTESPRSLHSHVRQASLASVTAPSLSQGQWHRAECVVRVQLAPGRRRSAEETVAVPEYWLQPDPRWWGLSAGRGIHGEHCVTTSSPCADLQGRPAHLCKHACAPHTVLEDSVSHVGPNIVPGKPC